MHIDDPLIGTCSDEDQQWMHSMLDGHFDTKSHQEITCGLPPGLSLNIRIMLHEDGKITMDNKDKIEVFLKQHGMPGCNPVVTPLTKEILLEVALGDQTAMDVADSKETLSVSGGWCTWHLDSGNDSPCARYQRIHPGWIQCMPACGGSMVHS